MGTQSGLRTALGPAGALPWGPWSLHPAASIWGSSTPTLKGRVLHTPMGPWETPRKGDTESWETRTQGPQETRKKGDRKFSGNPHPQGCLRPERRGTQSLGIPTPTGPWETCRNGDTESQETRTHWATEDPHERGHGVTGNSHPRGCGRPARRGT